MTIPTFYSGIFSWTILLFVLVLGQQKCKQPDSSDKSYSDCHADRATTAEVKSQAGYISQINESTFVLILDEEPSTRYLPCKLTDVWSIDKKPVIVSGLVKAIHANERWPGTPFTITSIKEK